MSGDMAGPAGEVESLADRVAELQRRSAAAEVRLAEVNATLRVNIKGGRLKGKDADWALRELLLLLFREHMED